MNEESTTRARLLPDGTMVEVLADGSTRPLEDKTDWARLEHTTDADIQQQIAVDPDVAPSLDDDFWTHARLVEPEVVAWFKRQYGERYQARMFAVLRAHMEDHSAV